MTNEPVVWSARSSLAGAPTALVMRPEVERDERLPVLYLFHGKNDRADVWWLPDRGDLVATLAADSTRPMVIVAPFCGQASGSVGIPESLAEFGDRFARIRAAVEATLPVDPARQALLGISMGAWLALSVVLRGDRRGDVHALALLSGMFQDAASKQALEQHVGAMDTWPRTLDRELLYHHYCGNGEDRPRPGMKALGGDRRFRPSNEDVCRRLTGGRSHVIPFDAAADTGMHNWNYWRPQVAAFVGQLSGRWT